MDSGIFSQNNSSEKKYISTKEASIRTGYSKDYIGQLARAGKIDSKKINRAWYVEESSLFSYKDVSAELKKENGKIFAEANSPLAIPPLLVEEGVRGGDSEITTSPFGHSSFIKEERVAEISDVSSVLKVYQHQPQKNYLGKQIFSKSREFLTIVLTVGAAAGIIYANNLKLPNFLQDFIGPENSQTANTIDSLKDAYGNFVTDPANASVSESVAVNIKQDDLLNAYKNYLTKPGTPSSILPLNKGERPKAEGVISSLRAVSPSISNANLVSAIKTILAQKEFRDQLRGPEGPQGASGLQGPQGPTGVPSIFSIPSAPTVNTLAYVPATVIPPNPSSNFAGATLLGATNLSSGSFSTTTASIDTLTVNGQATIGGTLTVTGTATIPTVAATASTTDTLAVGGGYGSTGASISAIGDIEANGALTIDGASTLTGSTVIGSAASSTTTIGSTTTPGALTLRGATTLDNNFSQTGANTFSTGTGAISLNGATTVTGSNTFATGTGAVTFNNVTTNIASDNPIIDLTSATTLSINTTTNRPITTGTGLFTAGGDVTIAGTTGATLSGIGAGITFTGTGNHDITASSGTLRIGSNTIIGSIEALDETVDIGTPAVRFDKFYANEVNATTLVGTITGGNSSAETFTINSDNATADTENSYLSFERGSSIPNALLGWDSTNDEFDLNSGLNVTNTIGSAAHLRLSYDASNYNSFTTSSTGDLAISSTGTNGNITLTPSGTGKTVIASNSTSWTYASTNLTLSTRSNGRGLTFATTDANDFTLSVFRNSIPAAPTGITALEFEGLDDAGGSVAYGQLTVNATDIAAATVTGEMVLSLEKSNVHSHVLRVQPATIRFFNTRTSDTVFEALQLDWTSNIARIFTNYSGGGSARALQLGGGGSTQWEFADDATGFRPLTDDSSSTGLLGTTTKRVYHGRFGTGGVWIGNMTSAAGLLNVRSSSGGTFRVDATSGAASITDTTASSSTTTGSLINAGGFGNAGAAYFGGALNVAGTTGSTFTPSAAADMTHTFTSANDANFVRLFFGRASATAMIGVAASAAQFTTSDVAGDLTIRNASGKINFSNDGGITTGMSLGASNLLTLTADLTVTGGNVGVGTATVASQAIRLGSTGLTGTTQYGIANVIVFDSTVATVAAHGIYLGQRTAATPGTLPVSDSIFIDGPTIGSSSAITTNTGLRIANQGATGITNAYGIDIAAQSGAATVNVGLRNAGTTLLTNTTASTSSATGALQVSGGVGIATAVTTATSMGLNVAHTGAITGTGYGGYFSKTGASTTNVGLYATASGATNNYAAIFESGNVGIGTTAPSTKLHISGTGSGTYLRIEETTAGEETTIQLLGDATRKNWEIGKQQIGNALTFASSTANGGTTFTNYRMTILDTGEVGIGTTSPAGLLHVSSDTVDLGKGYFTQANASADSFDFNFRKARGTGAVPTVITTADELGVINFTGYGGAAGYITGAAIKGISSGTIADSRVPGQLSFWTGTDAAPSVLTERMRIDNAGQVNVLATTASTSSTTGSLINAGGFGNAGAAYFGGALNVAGTTGSTFTPSAAADMTHTFTSANDANYARLNIGRASASFMLGVAASLGQFIATDAAGDAVIRTLSGNINFSNDGGATLGMRLGTSNLLTLAGDLTVTGGNVGVGAATNSSIGVFVTGASLLSGVSQTGLYSDSTFSSAATTSAQAGRFEVRTAAASFTVTNARALFLVAPTLGSGSAITNNYGIQIQNMGATGVTNAYGLDIAAQSGAATTNVGLRNAGTTSLLAQLSVSLDLASDYAATFFNDGNNANRSGLLVKAGLDDSTLAGPSTLIDFQDGDGGAIGSISFGSSATAYNTTSDERLKNLVNEQTTSSLNILNQIKIHDFTWKDDVSSNLYTGVFAQELYTIYPHAVTKPINPADSWMVDYSKLTPVMIASIQELDLTLEGLEERVAALEEGSPSLGSGSSSILDTVKNWLASAGNGITDIFAGTLHVTNQLCIGNTCVNEAQLQQILQSTGQASANSSSSTSGGGSTTDTTDTTPSDSPLAGGEETLTPDPSPSTDGEGGKAVAEPGEADPTTTISEETTTTLSASAEEGAAPEGGQAGGGDVTTTDLTLSADSGQASSTEATPTPEPTPAPTPEVTP
ncbi:tail fiber domain-containing protein [Candidatus Nomurabacteria bacterium]|nr:tail fiber domain-containing protein [Candidatus Nomurabacteria bacterium]